MPGKPWLRDKIGPRVIPPATYDTDLADPAKGEKVPRCRICGRPEQRGNKLLPGLWGYIRFNVDLILCESCVRALIPDDRTLADPLTLDDVA